MKEMPEFSGREVFRKVRNVETLEVLECISNISSFLTFLTFRKLLFPETRAFLTFLHWWPFSMRNLQKKPHGPTTTSAFWKIENQFDKTLVAQSERGDSRLVSGRLVPPSPSSPSALLGRRKKREAGGRRRTRKKIERDAKVKPQRLHV